MIGVGVHSRTWRITSMPSKIRESEIQENEIGIPRFDFDQTSLSRCRFVDSEAMAGKCCPKKAPDFRFILDENDRGFL